jgi:hypothetical protein
MSDPSKMSSPEKVYQTVYNKDLIVSDDVTARNLTDLDAFYGLVAGGAVNARKLHSAQAVSLRSRVRFVMAATSPLSVASGNEGWNRRVRRLATLAVVSRLQLPSGQSLEDLLRQERGLIMRWLMDAPREWVITTIKTEHNQDLKEKADYQNNSGISKFVASHLVPSTPDKRVLMDDLERAFGIWNQHLYSKALGRVSYFRPGVEQLLPWLYSEKVSRHDGQPCMPCLEGVDWARPEYRAIEQGATHRDLVGYSPKEDVGAFHNLRSHRPFSNPEDSQQELEPTIQLNLFKLPEESKKVPTPKPMVATGSLKAEAERTRELFKREPDQFLVGVLESDGFAL